MQNALQKKLLLATNNPGKVSEMRAILSELPQLKLFTPQDLGLKIKVAEVGKSYAENAAIKARAFAQASGMTTLADDSGLEVELLDGEPGLHSARYLPQPDATDADRRAYLLERLAGKPRPWRARFRCTVAIAEPASPRAALAAGEHLWDSEVQFAEGACEGQIIPEERGQGGFGYDPIFLVAGSKQTMAELDAEEKNQISHRARAVRAAFPLLRNLFGLD